MIGKSLPVLEHKQLHSRCLAFNIGGFSQDMLVEGNVPLN